MYTEHYTVYITQPVGWGQMTFTPPPQIKLRPYSGDKFFDLLAREKLPSHRNTTNPAKIYRPQMHVPTLHTFNYYITFSLYCCRISPRPDKLKEIARFEMKRCLLKSCLPNPTTDITNLEHRHLKYCALYDEWIINVNMMK